MRGEARGVRVYTVANESRYLVVRNVPAVGVLDELRARLSLFGTVLEFRALDHPDDRARALGPFRGQARRRQPLAEGAHAPSHFYAGEEEDEEDEQFTDVVWVQYETVNNARHAKARAGLKPFFGSMLRLSYAPQDETPRDTALKLAQRRELLLRRARQAGAGAQAADRARMPPRDSRERYTGLYPPPPPVHQNYARLEPRLPEEPSNVKRRRI